MLSSQTEKEHTISWRSAWLPTAYVSIMGLLVCLCVWVCWAHHVCVCVFTRNTVFRLYPIFCLCPGLLYTVQSLTPLVYRLPVFWIFLPDRVKVLRLDDLLIVISLRYDIPPFLYQFITNKTFGDRNVYLYYLPSIGSIWWFYNNLAYYQTKISQTIYKCL